LHRGHAFAANRDVEPAEPSMQRFPKLDLAAVGLQCLALQIEDNKAGPGTVRHANTNRVAGDGRPETWLDDEGNVVGMNLPAGVVCELLVGQGALGPPAIKEADFALFGAQIPGCGFDDATIYIKLKDGLFAVFLE